MSSIPVAAAASACNIGSIPLWFSCNSCDVEGVVGDIVWLVQRVERAHMLRNKKYLFMPKKYIWL